MTLWFVIPHQIVILVALDEQMLMLTATELATMEKGSRIRLITTHDGHNLYSQNPLCDDELYHRHSVQQFIHGNHGSDRHPFYNCCPLFTGKHHAFRGHWEKDCLHCVGISDAHRRVVEYARTLNIQLVYGLYGHACCRMGSERGYNPDLNSRHVLRAYHFPFLKLRTERVIGP